MQKLGCCNIMLKLQLGSIKILFQKSIVNIEHHYNTPFYTLMHRFIAIKCIQHIRNELERVNFVGSNKDVCGCFIRTKHVLPCACQLPSLQIQGETILLESIHVFWKKLYIEEHEVTQENSGHNWI